MGRDLDAILAAASAGELDALIVGAVDPDDLADPALALEALETVGFLVSIEQRESAGTARADVVLPVAAAVEKAGSYTNWEGRVRPFAATLEHTGMLTDARALHLVAAELGTDLGLPSVDAARRELDAFAPPATRPAPNPSQAAAGPARPGAGEAVLATWHHLLDQGRLQDGEPYLAGTARTPRALLSETTAKAIGATEGEPLTVSSDRGSITLPLGLAELPDGVVWLPTNSAGSAVRRDLAAGSGAIVRIAAGAAR